MLPQRGQHVDRGHQLPNIAAADLIHADAHRVGGHHGAPSHDAEGHGDPEHAQRKLEPEAHV
jgi:hypothetical protein